MRNSERVAHLLDGADDDCRRLVGAYLTHEVALEAAALTNPSMVPAPDQTDVPSGALRIVMSLRGISEGHVSSIEFRTGLIDQDGSVTLDAASGFAETGERRAPVYERKLFSVKLAELRADMRLAALVLDELSRHFSIDELETAVKVLDDLPQATSHETVKLIRWLASSNYVLEFDRSRAVDERVLFPGGPLESRGMEDARFVRFVDDDGTTTYYATYTAFDGFEILPQLIETKDFRTFEISTMNGRSAQNKGIAFFPRPIGGRYMAVSRPDRENIHVMSSDNPRFWPAPSTQLRFRTRAWELHPDRQLRLAAGDQRGLAGAHPRSRSDAHLSHWRRAARSGRSVDRHRRARRTDPGRGSLESAMATSPTWCTRAVGCSTGSTSSFPTASPTAAPVSRRSQSASCSTPSVVPRSRRRAHRPPPDSPRRRSVCSRRTSGRPASSIARRAAK